LGLKEDCLGKNFDGHLIANCDEKIIREFHQYDIRLINQSRFEGTVRVVLMSELYSIEIKATITGIKN
jgi:hypothetical protein